MLEAARKVGKEGVDVVVGYIEPHARPDTQALVLGLDVLPRREVNYRGATLLEFDLEAALARKPQLILVDELAHTNAPGLTHAKRWQDVEDLLAAGISVYSTLNVQHLESLNDVIAQITHVQVRETLPDSVFERADEIELVDLAPDDLIERLQEGKVYVPEQARRAIEHFFQKGHLIALRELALRRSAERVDAQMVNYRHEHSIERTWPATDRLLVSVGPSPMSARLIRATRRMAATLRAPWLALHVELPSDSRMADEDRQRLADNLHLAEQLGATTVTVPGQTLADEVISFARSRNVTKIIVGKPQQSRFRDLLSGSYVYGLTRRRGDINVYVISGESDRPATAAPRSRPQPVSHIPYAIAVGAVVAATVLGMLFRGFLAEVNLVMIYVLAVVAVSLRCGRGPSILASVLSVAAFDFFFVPPQYSFAIRDTQYALTFVVMLATGLTISELMARVTFAASAAGSVNSASSSLYAPGASWPLTTAAPPLPKRSPAMRPPPSMPRCSCSCPTMADWKWPPPTPPTSSSRNGCMAWPSGCSNIARRPAWARPPCPGPWPSTCPSARPTERWECSAPAPASSPGRLLPCRPTCWKRCAA